MRSTAFPVAACPVCESPRARALVRLTDVPVFCNVPQPSADAAASVERGDIDLVSCESCAHVYNRAFDEARLAYAPGYENPLHHSPKFRAYAADLVERLNGERMLAGADVVELGCGDGRFLGELARRGARCTGYDPSHAEDARPAPDGVRIVRATSADAPAGADWAVSRHVMEHLVAPVQALRGLHRVLAGRDGARAYVEVPNGMATIAQLGIWDLIYEHVSYFWSGSLACALERAGLRPVEIREEFDRQFLCATAAPVEPRARTPVPIPASVESALAAFEAAYRAKREQWRERLDGLAARAGLTVVWGAGSKGVTFLNVFRDVARIDAAVDVNPDKHGKFVAGTGHPIVSPEALRDRPPQVVIVMNPAYVVEVGQRLAETGISADVVTA